MTKFVLILPRLIIALQWLGPAAALYWTVGSRQSRGQTFFGARVEASFAESEAGRIILAEFRQRLWSWCLAGGVASLMVRINFASYVSFAGVMIGAPIAFGLANRRTRIEAVPASAPAVRVASLEASNEPADWWLGWLDWLAMLIPPAVPAAILVSQVLYPNALPGGPGTMKTHFAVAGLIMGVAASANHWALLHRARSSDWAPTPGASRKYRTYLGTTQSLGLTCVIAFLSCGFFAPPLRYFAITFSVIAVSGFAIRKFRSWLNSHLATGSIDPMPDDCWKWGSYYFNPDDPAIMVPLRSGVGQSMNMARPFTWAVWVLYIAVTIGLIIETAKLRLPNY